MGVGDVSTLPRGMNRRTRLAAGVGGGESESRLKEENTRDACGDSIETLIVCVRAYTIRV